MAQTSRYSQVILKKTLPTILNIALATLFFLGIGIWLLVENNMHTRHQERIDSFIEAFETAYSNELIHVEAIASSPLITQAIDDENGISRFYLNSYLASVDINRSYQTAISAYRANGRLISTNRELDIRFFQPVTEEPWFKEAMANTEPNVSVSIDGVIATAPIRVAGETRGVVVSELKHLGPWLNSTYEQGAVLILDQEERILYSSNEYYFTPFSQLSNNYKQDWREVNTRPYRDFTIVSLESQSLFMAELLKLYFFLLLATIFIFISGFIAARAAGKISDRTITEFIRAIENFEKFQDLGAMDHRVFEIKEIQHLKHQFQKLLHNLLVSNLSKERVSALINSLNDMMVVFDLEGNPILSNKSFDDFFTDKEFDHPDILTFLFHYKEEHPDLLNMDIPLGKFERDYIDGRDISRKRYIVEWRRTSLNDDHGNVIGAIFVGQDVTKSSELTTENELKEAAIDGADSGILILEQKEGETCIRYTNPSFHVLTGLSKEQLFNQSLSLNHADILPKDSFNRIDAAIKKNKSLIEVIPLQTEGSDHRHIEFIFSPIPTGSKTGNKFYLCIMKDVTQQQQTSRLLIDAKRRAEESAQLKSTFLASMSHEIRTPMNGVTGMLQILRDSPLNSQQQNYVRIAQGSAESLLHIINDILDFSKIEAGKISIENNDFSLCDMLDNFIDSMAHLADNKDLELILDTTQVHSCMAKGDPGRLRQILTNLVGNAIKFTQSGDILVTVKELENLRMQISVSDTGKGIPKEYQSTLFEPFTQVDDSSADPAKGTGLGLAIVKQLIEGMDGHISVESEPGVGSTFSFEIQLAPSSLSARNLDLSNMKDKKLLLIDDNIRSRSTICKHLKQWGIEVKGFSSSSDALNFLTTEKGYYFHAAVIDSGLPDISGLELGRKIQTLPKTKEMNMLLMTSFNTPINDEELKAAGFNGYFAKPVKLQNLAEALNLLFKQDDPNKEVISDKMIQAMRKDSTFTKNHRILLVEDNVVNQMISKKFIESFGLTTIIRADGQKAIDELINSSETYDMVVMDCQMPVIDGFEATRMIRSGEAGERYKDVPIVAMTANVLNEDKDRCLNAGMSDYLAKPLRREQLVKTLKKWLD